MFSIQAGALLDLRNRRMGQTHILHTTVDISTLPACFPQSRFQMLTDAPQYAFLCEQNNVIFLKFQK